MAIEKNGKKWRVVVSNGIDSKTGKRIRITRTVGAKKDAILFNATITKEVKSKIPSGHSLCDMTLDEYYQYFKINCSSNLTENTIMSYDNSYRRISAALGNAKISKIETCHILEFYRQLDHAPRLDGRGEISARTKRKHHELLSRLFTKAFQWHLILVNPMSGIEPPKWTYKNTTKIPDKNELGKLLSALTNETTKHQLWILFTFSTGVRRGELFGIKWGDIDFEKKTVYIHRSITAINHQVKEKETKTETSTRTISLSDSVITLLEKYREEYLKYYQQIVKTSIFQGAGNWDDEYIFITHTGRVSHPDAFNSYLKAFTKRYDLQKLTPHVLRHSSASYLIANNVDIQTVASRLGHASTAVTQLVYSHLLQSVEHESANVMEQILQKNNLNIDKNS